MNRHFMTGSLLACCCAATLLSGCLPDNSLIWSGDGSVGLFRAEGKLFVVDGATGELTPIRPEGGVSLMPDISADGKWIAYGVGSPCATVQEGLELFPPFMAETIRRDASQLAQKLTAGLVQPTTLMSGDGNPLGFSDAYYRWVVRTMCENPDETLVASLGPDQLAKCRECEIGYTRLIVAPRAHPEKTTALVVMPVVLFRPRFSPDGRYVAYIVPELHDHDKGTLYIASTDGKTSAAEVAARVAVNYDWRPDGRALAYVKQESDALLGVLEEKIVVDETGALQAELSADAATAPVGIQRFADQGRQLVGTLFQPFTKVQYGSAGRLFFSSPIVKIPTSSLEEPTYSLFCYDITTGTVVDVLPASVAALTGDMVNFFALAPDGTRVLLPMEHHRFAIYTLSDKTPVLPIDEDEEFGKDVLDMLPSWRSNTEISCLVSGGSRFLGGSAQGQEARHEVVVLNVDGSFRAQLSKDWPDDVIP